MSRLLGYGAGEVIDRVSILCQKLYHNPKHDAKQREDQSKELEELLLDPRITHVPLREAAALCATNGELWGHEDQIRRWRERDMGIGCLPADVATVAMEIQELNDRRARIVKRINRLVAEQRGEASSND